MILEQLNEWGACSSLMLRNLHDVRHLSEENMTHLLCSLWSKKLPSTETMNPGTYPHHCSFVCVSLTPNMVEAEAFFKDCGFTYTEPVHNEKNGTSPFFGVVSVPVFQDSIKRLYEKHRESVDRLLGAEQSETLRAIFEGRGPALRDDDEWEDDDWMEDDED